MLRLPPIWIERTLLMVIAVFCGSTAAAEHPGVRNVFHMAWSSESGVSAVFEVQQDISGYLWLTTANGVFRFDGVSFQSLDFATDNAVHNRDVSTVYIAPSGRMWFTTRTAGLILYEKGRAQVYPLERRCISAYQTRGMVEDADGSLWVKSLAGLYHVKGTSCEQVGTDGGYPGGTPAAILRDSRDAIWVKSATGAVVVREKGAARFTLWEYASAATAHAAFLHEAPDGDVWLSDDEGLRPVGRSAEPIRQQPRPLPKPHAQTSHFGDFAFSLRGDLWAMVDNAVSRFDWPVNDPHGVSAGSAKMSFARADGLTSNAIWNLRIDREDNVWVGTNSGLDRLRTTALTTVSLPPAQENTLSLAAGDDGTVWTGNGSLALTQVSPDGKLMFVRKTRSAIGIRRAYDGSVWVASDGPVYLWRSVGKEFVPLHYPNEESARVVAVAVDRNHEPWINIRSGATYHLTQGVWHDESPGLGKNPGILGTMTNDADGNVWLAYENHLVRWDGKNYQRASFAPGTIGLSVGSLAAKGEHVWMAGSGGIVYFYRGVFRPMEFADHALPGRVSGVVEASNGDLWINGYSGITHVPATELQTWFRDATHKIAGEHMDALDGLPGLSAERFPEPSVVEASDGRIWFATPKGIAWVDSASLLRARNNLPPPVFVTALVAGGKTYPASEMIRLPEQTQNLEIDYTALSLAVPQRVMFRYKLEGIDKEWQDAGTRRAVFYTRLPPRNYAFLVMASNNDGIWSTKEARLNFTVPPTFLQTGWFKMLCALALVLTLAAAYLFRVRLLTARIRSRLMERMAERERIARDLHDTFFQGIQGLFLRFNTGTRLLPPEEPARRIFVDALEESDRVMAEGRELVLDLRAEDMTPVDFVMELERMHSLFDDAAEYKILTIGTPREVHPVCARELLSIAREAVFNASQHADAAHVEVELSYTEEFFRITVEDDGRGIEEAFLLKEQIPGHMGLVDMRERANRLKARYKLCSGKVSGTRVQVELSAQIAFTEARKSSTTRMPAWLKAWKPRY